MTLQTKSVASLAARAANGSSSAVVASAATVGITVRTTVAGTSLALVVEWSADGTNWGAADPADTFTAITATGVVSKSFAVKAPFYRVTWTPTGSFTFSVDALEYGGS